MHLQPCAGGNFVDAADCPSYYSPSRRALALVLHGRLQGRHGKQGHPSATPSPTPLIR